MEKIYVISINPADNDRYAEEDPGILGSGQNPVQVLAFCTGLLPAAALVAARDTSELFDIGIEIISITFRMAHEIIRRMRLIEETKRSWAVTVVGKAPEQVQPILDAFHEAQVSFNEGEVAIKCSNDIAENPIP